MPRNATTEKPAEKPAFDPNDHLTDLKGKAYLGARWRLKWLRTEHPDWTISTAIVEMDFEKGYGIVRAEVLDETGRLIANAIKTETRKDFFDFLEKAETGAIGRACAVAGYGTEDALDLDEGEAIADAPVARGNGRQPVQNAPRAAQPQPVASRPATAVPEPDDEDVASLHPSPVTSAVCQWKLGQGQGKPALVCGMAPGHDGEHSWIALALSGGGRVIPPTTR